MTNLNLATSHASRILHIVQNGLQPAGIEPHVDMNPILLKPMDGVSQVVLEGAPIGVMSARD